MFVAINRIQDGSIFPTDLTLSDAIFAETFIAPFNDEGPFPFQVPETILSTDFVLGPGTYSIMSGSGLFGATGSGWMPIAPFDLGNPSYFFMNNHTGELAFHDGGFQPARFLVEGRILNEPSALLLFVFGVVAAGSVRRFRVGDLNNS